MKRTKIYMALAALLAVAVSCDNPVEPEKRDEIKLSTSSLEFVCDQGQSGSVEVLTEGEWVIKDYSDGMKAWLEIDATSGTGNAVVNFKTVETNPYDSKRMAVLSFVSGDAVAKLVIKQYSDPERSVSLSEDLLAFGGPLDEKTFKVVTSKAWSIDESESVIPSWLSFSQTSGSGMEEITVKTLEMNEEIDTREASICVRIDRVHSATLTVSQAPGVEFSISSKSLSFKASEAETQTLSVKCNSSTKVWNVVGYDDSVKSWLNIDKLSGTGDADIHIQTLGLNNDLTKETTLQVKIDEKRCIDLTISQASGITISVEPAKLEFGGNEADTLTVVVKASSDKYPWTVEGYGADAQAWFNLDLTTASALEKTITLRTLGANKSGHAYCDTLKFVITEGVEATLIVTQAQKAAAQKIISWAGASGVVSITAPEGATYKAFPYSEQSEPTGAATVWYDGVGGEVINTGAYTRITRDFVFQMSGSANVGETYTLELGPCASTTEKTGYGNLKIHNWTGIRGRNFYIKAPAIKGYRLTQVDATCGNAADRATSVTLGTSTAVTSATKSTATNVVDGYAQLTFGKPTPVQMTLTSTEPNTEYYLFFVADRLVSGFTFTYSEVQ